jgi:hypothetical protein
MSKRTQSKEIFDLIKQHSLEQEIHKPDKHRLQEAQGHLKTLRSIADKQAYLDQLEHTERNKVLIELVKSYMRAGIMARNSGPLGHAIQSFKDAKGEDGDK